MFDKLGESIDAVIIATPDHTHAIITAQAIKLGKHVYSQKPLTHTVYESRLLKSLAKNTKWPPKWETREIQVTGFVKSANGFGMAPSAKLTKFMPGPTAPSGHRDWKAPTESFEVPSTLDWDLFIGPAQWRPYHPSYTPWNWRAWWDFGTGALGDMACHIVDPAFWALKLGHPMCIYGSSTQVNTESAPHSEMVHYEFPDRGTIGNIKLLPLKMTWYDGGLLPPRPAELKDGQIMGDQSGGVLFIGTKGKLMTGCYGRNPILLPEELHNDYKRPLPTIRRIEDAMEGGHELDWIRACKESPESRVQTSSNFDYSGPLNELVVMGNLAVRLQDLNRKLMWDGENMRITNISETDEIGVVTSDKFTVIEGHPNFDTQYATIKALQASKEYVKHSYREGWEL